MARDASTAEASELAPEGARYRRSITRPPPLGRPLGIGPGAAPDIHVQTPCSPLYSPAWKSRSGGPSLGQRLVGLISLERSSSVPKMGSAKATTSVSSSANSSGVDWSCCLRRQAAHLGWAMSA